MTAIDPPLDSADPLASPIAAPAQSRWHGFEDLLDRTSEWLNPILVKETRQSLKSYQFFFTFFL